nr:MAG TPA: hypothetical protein [Caudoviricetes sp.]
MKIHKEMVWNKGFNPKKDGEYLLAGFLENGRCYSVLIVGYTVAYGWNTSSEFSTSGWGQNPNDGRYVWAEMPF